MIYGVLDPTNGQKRKELLQILKPIKGKAIEVTNNINRFKDYEFVLLYGILRGLDIVYKFLNKNNINFYYIDNSYWGTLGPQGTSRRITYNELQNTKFKKRDSKRTPINIQYNTWGPKGDYILVLPPTNAIINVTEDKDWLDTVINKLKEVTNRKIIIRKKGSKAPLEQQLNKSYCIVVHTSRVGVDAVLAGLPVISSDHSACSIISKKFSDIDTLQIYEEPDREGFINHLAYSQFTREELKNGTAWNIILAT